MTDGRGLMHSIDPRYRRSDLSHLSNERNYQETDTSSTVSSGEYSIEQDLYSNQTSEHSDSSSNVTELVALEAEDDKRAGRPSEDTFVQLLKDICRNKNIMKIIEELKPEIHERLGGFIE